MHSIVCKASCYHVKYQMNLNIFLHYLCEKQSKSYCSLHPFISAFITCQLLSQLSVQENLTITISTQRKFSLQHKLDLKTFKAQTNSNADNLVQVQVQRKLPHPRFQICDKYTLHEGMHKILRYYIKYYPKYVVQIIQQIFLHQN